MGPLSDRIAIMIEEVDGQGRVLVQLTTRWSRFRNRLDELAKLAATLEAQVRQ